MLKPFSMCQIGLVVRMLVFHEKFVGSNPQKTAMNFCFVRSSFNHLKVPGSRLQKGEVL
jgi:hypothetical protein